jgi:PD-(D/E)XK nuclease superfamily
VSGFQARLGNIFGRPTGKTEASPKKAPSALASLPSPPAGRPPDVDWFMLADSYLYEHGNAPNEGRTQGVFHPSAGLIHEQGHCLRQIVFDLLCAPRSSTLAEPQLLRIFENGHNREVGLDKLFQGMADKGHFGIVRYERQIPAQHKRLPIAGTADARITMRNGHRYILDFKTINKNNGEKTNKPSNKYALQLNTYLGLLGEKTAYVIYEVKDNQSWLKPAINFRLDFDPDLFAQTEQFCEEIMHEYVLGKIKIPAYEELVCKGKSKFDAAITLCDYRAICEKHRAKPNAQKWDWRTDDVKKRHLEVIQ